MGLTSLAHWSLVNCVASCLAFSSSFICHDDETLLKAQWTQELGVSIKVFHKFFLINIGNISVSKKWPNLRCKIFTKFQPQIVKKIQLKNLN